MMTPFGSKCRTKGQAALLMTMTLTIMLGAMGLVVDFGWAYWRKVAAGTAASSAATAAVMAGSGLSSCGSGTTGWNCTSSYSCAASPTTPPSNNLDNGCLYAKQNGFLNTGRQTVTMQSGTGATGAAPGITPAYYVTAHVTENIPTLFSAVLGQSWMQVKAESTAAIYTGSTGACIYILSTTADQALHMTGGTVISGCGIDVDSSATDAVYLTGGSLGMTGGAGISVVGQSQNGTSHMSFSGGGSLKTGQSVHGDPFAGKLTTPTPSGSCTPDPNYGSGTSNITIPSGTYCALTIAGGTGLTLSGTYIITQGSFKMTGGSASTASGGAMIYIASTSSGNINLTSGTLTLNGLTSTTNNGIALWQANTQTATITDTSATINGVIYVPNSLFNYTGGSTTSTTTVVTNTLNFTGGNISHPATSSLYTSGYSPGGNFIVE
jgi:hypothetical protein